MPTTLKISATLFAVLALSALSGCGGQSGEHLKAAEPPTLENPEAVSACLPTGVTLETKLTTKEGDVETVKDALARCKAKTKNKRLYDSNGREVHFYRSSSKGLMINQDKEYNKLRKRYTVFVYEGS